MNKCVDRFYIPFILRSLNCPFTDIQFAVVTKTEIAAKDIYEWLKVRWTPERLN